ncbi:MAG: carbon-nitrogen hydrolase family protein [Myxococcales bacterium]|nr:carbon-nitrogen hydrolase family protein [Myxococcales bacterium]
MKRFTAAAVQFAPVHTSDPDCVQKNLDRAHAWLVEAKRQSGAELFVLPESFTTGFTPAGAPADARTTLWNAVDTIPGKLTDVGIDWARELDAYIVFPTYERGPTPEVLYNSAALIGPEGLLGVYRKTHPFASERIVEGVDGNVVQGWTTPGHAPLCVETRLGKIGVIICYDGDFPELSRVTALLGAEVICRPSAFMRTFDHWELTNRARAYDNHVYWIATNAVGLDASGAYCFGGSMIVHPNGVKLAQARGGEEAVWASLDPDPIRTVTPNSTAEQHFDHLQDRNLLSYADILTEGMSAFEPAKRVPYER